MGVVAALRGVFATTAATTGVEGIISQTGTILSAVVGWLTQLTTWILADPLAIMFFAIMLLMLAIHVLNSLVHKFS